MQVISNTDKRFFEETKKQLALFGSKECNFLKVELLFYDTLQVARHYGDDPADNSLLAALKQLQLVGFAEAKTRCNKVTTQERLIKRFNGQFRAVLGSALRKQPCLTPAV
ncbi:MAG: hypothetical protein EOO14_03110 [Chitinophagaceae bacterium]|nr:MAG: hypothetical protein EOO14_03110 [Chitinophagaceae bacterium]